VNLEPPLYGNCMMPARNVILRIMLWSLGLAAATGVLTVFVQYGDFMWRVIGTEVCAAVACGLILPCIALIDRRKTREAGMLGMIGVVVEFILALIAIWDLPRTLAGVGWEEELWFTIVILAVATIVAMGLLKLNRQAEHSVTARTELAVVGAATCTFLIAVWWNRSRNVSENCAETGAAILALGTIASVCLLGLGGPVRRSWRWGGVICAAVAFAMWLGDIWIGSGSDIGRASFAALLITAATVAYAIACLLCPLKPTQVWLRGATIAAAALTGALIELLVLTDCHLLGRVDGYWIERCMAAAGIVTGCGTLALAVLARMNRRVDFEMDGGILTEIVVVCPRCRKKQTLPLGDTTCTGCRLRISTRVEEPRCPTCDYLLFGLTSDRCPECGTAIDK